MKALNTIGTTRVPSLKAYLEVFNEEYPLTNTYSFFNFILWILVVAYLKLALGPLINSTFFVTLLITS